MSLHTLANQLQGAGRGEDKMLVHMTPGEVGGLQQLAMAHGGSLSINPQTGLPEAGILGRLLPTVLGFALGPAGMGISFGGLSSAASAGLISGAVGTLATGSLGKGIMAGMGAYGGASLGQSLMGAGTAASQTFPLTAPTPMAPPPTLAGTMAQNPVLKAATDPSMGGMAGNVTQAAETAKPFANWAQGNLAGGVRPLDVKVSAPEETFGSRMGAAGRGLKKVFESPETAFDFAKENVPSLAAIATSMSSDITAGPPKEKEKSKGMEKYRYVYDRDPVGVASSRSSERDYFPNARYEPTGEYYAAGGGLMGLANGGPIEEMSRLNTIGANTGYPMANQMSSTYASPAERPISENIISPQGDANVDPYTGVEKFADGGYTRYTGTRPLDEDKDDYYYVPGTASGSGYYMVRDGTQGNGFNSASFGKPGYEMAKGSARGDGSSGEFNYFDPSYYNPQTGTYGGKPAATKAPTLGTEAVEQTRETLNPMYQKYFGRDIDESGLATYTSRPFSESELDKIFTGAGEYQTAAPLRAAREQEAAAKEREANLATPEQAADIYERVMGRTPDLPGLEYYAKTNRMTPEEMEKSLRGSDEYFKNLAKPFVPAITYGDDGRASIEGAPKYDPSQYGFAAGGGISDLGGYSDGGRLLKGPGDGVSDSIPAVIGQRQPARLADGEFVIPARIVSELGNGSTDAGARKLYAMMERIQSARKKSVGKGRVAANTKSEKYLPA
jgi:hypothetical protein